MEGNSDNVLIGKVLHQNSYSRKKKEIMIDNKIAIDFMEKEGIINEIKKSNKMEKAHIYQMLYYLYYLENKGLKNLKGVINYPLLKKKEEVILTDENREEIKKILNDIKNITLSELPPVLKKLSHCRSCSYYELCWV
jgi:CRISPR-associated exonuclease Cas4